MIQVKMSQATTNNDNPTETTGLGDGASDLTDQQSKVRNYLHMM